MRDLGRGIIAGFVATLAISMLMIMRISAGIMTWFNPIDHMNLTAQEVLGTPNSAAIGWIIHFLVGAVLWGGLFSLLVRYMPGHRYATRGLVFGTLVAVVVMLTVLPLAGSGFFGLGFGVVGPVYTLVIHWIYGAVLGAAYGFLQDTF